MDTENWQQRFHDVFERGRAAWTAGRQTADTMFEKQDEQFLASIGHTAQELFDFIEDIQNYGEPDYATALAIAEIRRDYFLRVMGGRFTGVTGLMSDLPEKTKEVDGIAWLPRIIMKARLKLRGEMPAELMYGCGGDRAFLQQVKMTLPGFLKLVRDHGGEDQYIIETVKRSAGRK